jgi:predicted TIM-barrel fold metal-dependent hydrolase
MDMYQELYMDVAVINWIDGAEGRPRFHEFLREMFAAGLGKRIMFGTDQMQWPEAIRMAIDSIESAGFLTEQQRRDIFYNNAARFLRLDHPEAR